MPTIMRIIVIIDIMIIGVVTIASFMMVVAVALALLIKPLSATSNGRSLNLQHRAVCRRCRAGSTQSLLRMRSIGLGRHCSSLVLLCPAASCFQGKQICTLTQRGNENFKLECLLSRAVADY